MIEEFFQAAMVTNGGALKGAGFPGQGGGMFAGIDEGVELDGSRSCGEFRRMLGVIGADSANADHCE